MKEMIYQGKNIEWGEVLDEGSYKGLNKSYEILVSTIGFKVLPIVIVLHGVFPGTGIPANVVPIPLFSPSIGNSILYP